MKQGIRIAKANRLAACLTVLLLLSVGGCELLGLSKADLTLSVHRSSYEAGEKASLTLKNNALRSYTVHPELCDARLQRRENGAWQLRGADRVCTAVGYELGPGQEVEAARELPADLRPGTYRFTYEVFTREEGERSHETNYINVYTRAFEVSQ